MLPIRVISLQRTPERRQAFLARNGHLPCTFFDAVDGARLTPEDIAATGLFAPGLARTYTPGAYGAALSHWQLWGEAIDGGRPLTVAEDDAVFRHDFADHAQRLLDGLPVGWDFMLWGWNFDSVLSVHAMPGVSPAAMVFDQAAMRGSLDAFQALRDPVLALRLDKCFGIPAYTISPAGAARLRKLCFPLSELSVPMPILNRSFPNLGIDAAMNAAYSNTSSHASFPALVVTCNDARISTIQRQRPSRES
ncbi:MULTISPECIES: glycosyltransferase family 25 protein [Ramlibacter]|uniref:Glycosyl transferase n=1 Tax=Ramlibacter pinisoli TaxID=2682844 RepID=A0A6N8IYX1_9BURK|nr:MULTISPECIES: glycosyltransferase family 25 protein [Ramlibacter]MBA2961201.1 glycosyltransferase family 25 protein [Ramlibacter sp. CGMCC 1.13660]MVQ31146.1 glycosyl transferase [Ramlibacter pinisoli]